MPIYTSRTRRRRPPARQGWRPASGVSLLVVLNLVVFAFELQAGTELETFLRRWGLVPVEVLGALRREPGSDPAALFTLISSLFLHAGWLHLAVNLLYLVIFGSAVESILGGARFVSLYLIGGVVADAAHLLAQPGAQVPAIGASGAVAAVIAAHVLVLPGATLGTLAPVLFFRSADQLSAVALLLVWLLAQLLSGVASLGEGPVTVAWWSHVGGFAGGLVLAAVLRPRHRW